MIKEFVAYYTCTTCYILGRTLQELQLNFMQAKSLLTSLGFLVNEEKSTPGPLQGIEFLGFLINSEKMSLSVTNENLRFIISQCKTLLAMWHTTIRHLARVIGKMTSLNPAVLPGPLHYQSLQELKNEALSLHRSYNAKISRLRW